ncbi:MAG: T9SS type A sorting domain-containing protein [Ignavibacterium sp.]|nr:T9SS type A sorting domain-containing protein [Ignavibacterium sp.]
MCWDSILTKFSESGSESIFNENRNIRTYEYSWLMSYTHKLAQGIGIYNIRNGYDFGKSYFFLNGCVINDVVYGDTTLTGVDDQQIPIPTEYNLEQNYPNPFNPSTRIQYAIASRQFVNLKVYDVLGKEVATLVNEENPAGSYEVEFNSVETFHATSLPSGVYFYQLRAGDYIETRKMILMK